MPKAVISTVQTAIDILKGMSEAQLQELRNTMKTNDIALPRVGKAEKVYVAVRTQKIATKVGARVARAVGQEFLLTEVALMNTLTTWVKKDADTLVPLKKASILSGHTEDFTTFKLTGIIKA